MAIESENRLCGLILLDAWGFKEMDEPYEEKLAKMKWWARGLYHCFKGLGWTGLDIIRQRYRKF